MMVQTMFKLLINGKGLIFYFAPRRQPRGLPEDAIPNEVRDAAVLFDKTG